ncbi:MAG: phospholipid scramblase-related protein [Candidatus Omnitrophota bacterium]
MQELESLNMLMVSQKKEWGEILSGFETKNKYVIKDQNGSNIYCAGEVGGNWFLRVFLKAFRPFTLDVRGFDNRPIIRLIRPFRFYYHKADIFKSDGGLLGTIKKNFSFLARKYSIFNDSQEEIYQLFGPIFHPWTFIIKQNGREVGKIAKKWSGLFKEGFTDADNFAVVFPAEADLTDKGLLLGAVFLIDFVHFENTGNS